ncbi:MAG: AMP-binding protein [Deltaproteobacteria bacterium]|nr:AMP-binding protein [Deltaproteobacteria bacterium]
MNLVETLSQAARQWPDRPAVVEGEAVLSYRDLWREVEALRARLENLGIGGGQGVGVLGRNSRAFVVSALAASACGAVVLPLHPQLRATELAEILALAPLTAVISEAATPHRLEGSRDEVSLLDGTPLAVTRRAGVPPAPLVPWVPDAAFLRFTSGTTGAAKGVILTHRGVLERVAAANEGLGLGPEDAVLWVLPMAYHFFVSIVLYLSVGAAVVLCPDLAAESLLDVAERHRATFLYAAPLHIRLLTAEPSGRRLPASLRRVMSVSSPLTPQAARDFHARFGVPVSQGYGIIEVGLPVMNIAEAAARPEAIGRPLTGYDVAVLDDDGNPVADGETGQLALRGPGLFAGYLAPPLPAETVLRDGFFLTGDLVHRDAEGLLTIDGRSKTLINIAGHKVFPEEVSGVLDRHPAVARSRISMRPHPQFGEVVHAEVELAEARSASAEELLRFCRQHLSGHKVPASIDVVPRITLTPSGKVRYV